MLAAWIEAQGGAPVIVTTGLSAFVAVVAAVVRCYRLRVLERMHAARLEAGQKIAKPARRLHSDRPGPSSFPPARC